MKALTLLAASALLLAVPVAKATSSGCPTGYTCTYDPDVPGKIVSQTPTPTTHVVYDPDTGASTSVRNSPSPGPGPSD